MDRELLQRGSGGSYIVGMNKAEEDRLKVLCESGFVKIEGSDTPRSGPMSPMYRITNAGIAALSR